MDISCGMIAPAPTDAKNLILTTQLPAFQPSLYHISLEMDPSAIERWNIRKREILWQFKKWIGYAQWKYWEHFLKAMLIGSDEKEFLSANFLLLREKEVSFPRRPIREGWKIQEIMHQFSFLPAQHGKNAKGSVKVKSVLVTKETEKVSLSFFLHTPTGSNRKNECNSMTYF